MKRLYILLAVLGASSLMANGASFAADEQGHVHIAPSDIHWQPNASWPGGPQTTVLFGDPTKAGPYSVRVRMPAHLKIPPHSHPDQIRMVTILSGTLYLGLGDKFDETKLQAFTAGTFLTEAQNMKHFGMTKDEDVILQLDAIGPSGMTYVNPADDPARK